MTLQEKLEKQQYKTLLWSKGRYNFAWWLVKYEKSNNPDEWRENYLKKLNKGDYQRKSRTPILSRYF